MAGPTILGNTTRHMGPGGKLYTRIGPFYDYSVYLIQADLVRNLPKALLGFSDFSDTRLRQ